MNDLVSVVMATYNEQPYIVECAINSILGQTYQKFELFIMDDSTHEATIKAIDFFKTNEKITIIREPYRMGLSKARNIAMRLSRGKYIAIMDSDDISLPERLAVEVEYLQKHPNISVIGGQIDIIDGIGKVVSHRSYPTGEFGLWLFSCFRNPLAHPTVMFRRELIDKGYRYDETLKLSEDLDLWLRLMNDGYKIANIDKTVLKYRVLGNFNGKRANDTQREYMAKVRKKNFSRKHFAHSLLSTAAGKIFKCMPSKAIAKIYDRENKSQ